MRVAVRFTLVVAASLHITAGVALIDDQQRDGRQLREVVLACARERGLGEFLEQRMGLAIHDAVTLQNGRATDGLCEVALGGAGRTEKEDVLAPSEIASHVGRRQRSGPSSSDRRC
jgi:hypothetical protein